MENLTMLQRVIRPHTGLEPLEGYALVVYEQLGEAGAEFRGIIKPGKRFRKGPFILGSLRSRNYLAIAVNLSPELRLPFTEHFKLDDQVHEFDLSFSLAFCVTDPESVATARNEDPLRRVRDEIIRVVGRRIVRAAPEEIRRGFRKLEQAVIRDCLNELQRFSGNFGLGINSLALDVHPSATWIEVDLRKEEAARERAKVAIDEATARVKVDEVSKTEDVKRRREQEKRKKDLQNQIELIPEQDRVLEFEQGVKLREGRTDAIISAVTGVGRNITTPGELLDAANAARAISGPFTTGRASLSETSRGFLEEGAAATPYSTNGDEGGWIEMLAQSLTEINAWSYPFEQRRALGSAILHITAEALLDDRAKEDVLERYSNELFDLSRQLDPPLSAPQNRIIEKYKKYQKLREDLK